MAIARCEPRGQLRISTGRSLGPSRAGYGATVDYADSAEVSASGAPVHPGPEGVHCVISRGQHRAGRPVLPDFPDLAQRGQSPLALWPWMVKVLLTRFSRQGVRW